MCFWVTVQWIRIVGEEPCGHLGKRVISYQIREGMPDSQAYFIEAVMIILPPPFSLKILYSQPTVSEQPAGSHIYIDTQFRSYLAAACAVYSGPK